MWPLSLRESEFFLDAYYRITELQRPCGWSRSTVEDFTVSFLFSCAMTDMIQLDPSHVRPFWIGMTNILGSTTKGYVAKIP